MKYVVTYVEKFVKNVVVEATDHEEAIARVFEAVNTGEVDVVADSDNYDNEIADWNEATDLDLRMYQRLGVTN